MEGQVKSDLKAWEEKILKRSSLYKRTAKRIQKNIHDRIPERIHQVVTNSVRNMVKATLTGTEFTTNRPPLLGKTLQERDELVNEKKAAYKKTAMAEGAGTGAGGILWGLADFPLLLGIKMRFLFEAARIYGYDTKQEQERIFLLYVFLLAFSSDEVRSETYFAIKNWEQTKQTWGPDSSFNDEYDWKTFQMSYRDHIDVVKMFQMLPGFGAIVGALGNYHFLDQLGETAMNCYRLRSIQTKEG